MTVILLSLIEYEYNRQVNNNMHEPNTSEEFYMNRVKLFAVPVDNASGEEFEKLDVLNWYEIRLEMLKYRKEIEALEIHQLNYDLAAIGLFSISFAGLMIYSPALWAAEYKFGNEIEVSCSHFVWGNSGKQCLPEKKKLQILEHKMISCYFQSRNSYSTSPCA